MATITPTRFIPKGVTSIPGHLLDCGDRDRESWRNHDRMVSVHSR